MERDIDRRFLILRDWINIIEDYTQMKNERNKYTDFKGISRNLNAIEYLKKTNSFLNFSSDAYKNKNAMHILKQRLKSFGCIKFNLLPWESICRIKNDDAMDIIYDNIDNFDVKIRCILLNILLFNKYAIKIIEKYLHEFNDKHWAILSYNENAVHILMQNPDKIEWSNLSQNPNEHAICLLKKNIDKINWTNLCKNTNPEAIELLENNYDKINWLNLSRNPNATQLLRNNLHMIEWSSFCMNKNPAVIRVLMKNLDKIDWISLCKNDNAVHLIEQNLNKLDETCFKMLSSNKNAMDILKNNQDKIEWIPYEMFVFWPTTNENCILYNPSIFTYNYKEIKEIKHNINKDLIEWIWNPDNRDKWKNWRL
jgi:hypothetical protein